MEEENEEERIQNAVLKAEFEYDLAREEEQLEYLRKMEEK